MSYTETRERCHKEGNEAELRFADFLSRKGFSVRTSSPEEDAERHVDLWLCASNKDYKIDVKTHRPCGCGGIIETEWVELQNVRGNKGWVYGDADIIAYERPEGWLVIKRKLLQKIVEELTTGRKLTDCKCEIGGMYRRAYRKDIVVRVPICLIEKHGRLLRYE